MILFAVSVKNFFFKLTHRNIFLLVKVTRAIRPRAQKSAPSICQTRLVLRPTELYFRHAIIQILPDICRYILSNIHKFNSPDRLTYIRFFCIVLLFFFWQIRLGREVTGDSTPPLTPLSLPMPRSRPILSHRVYLSQVNFSEVSSFAIWTCFIIYTTKIRQISKTEKKKLYRPNLS